MKTEKPKGKRPPQRRAQILPKFRAALTQSLEYQIQLAAGDLGSSTEVAKRIFESLKEEPVFKTTEERKEFYRGSKFYQTRRKESWDSFKTADRPNEEKLNYLLHQVLVVSNTYRSLSSHYNGEVQRYRNSEDERTKSLGECLAALDTGRAKLYGEFLNKLERIFQEFRKADKKETAFRAAAHASPVLRDIYADKLTKTLNPKEFEDKVISEMKRIFGLYFSDGNNYIDEEAMVDFLVHGLQEKPENTDDEFYEDDAKQARAQDNADAALGRFVTAIAKSTETGLTKENEKRPGYRHVLDTRVYNENFIDLALVKNVPLDGPFAFLDPRSAHQIYGKSEEIYEKVFESLMAEDARLNQGSSGRSKKKGSKREAKK